MKRYLKALNLRPGDYKKLFQDARLNEVISKNPNHTLLTSALREFWGVEGVYLSGSNSTRPNYYEMKSYVPKAAAGLRDDPLMYLKIHSNGDIEISLSSGASDIWVRRTAKEALARLADNAGTEGIPIKNAIGKDDGEYSAILKGTPENQEVIKAFLLKTGVADPDLI